MAPIATALIQVSSLSYNGLPTTTSSSSLPPQLPETVLKCKSATVVSLLVHPGEGEERGTLDTGIGQDGIQPLQPPSPLDTTNIPGLWRGLCQVKYDSVLGQGAKCEVWPRMGVSFLPPPFMLLLWPVQNCTQGMANSEKSPAFKTRRPE